MGYISKYDRTFVSYMNINYKKYKVCFTTFDDYIMWLYYKFCKSNTDFYYRKLEKDLWDYSNFQTGSPRDIENKNGDEWKQLEKDKYGFYKNDNYVEYLRKNEWKNGKNKRS